MVTILLFMYFFVSLTEIGAQYFETSSKTGNNVGESDLVMLRTLDLSQKAVFIHGV